MSIINVPFIHTVSFVQSIRLFQNDIIDQLDPDVVDQLDPGILQQLRDGVIDKIPEDAVDKLPTSVRERIPDGLIKFASDNPALAIIFAIIGVLAILGFLFSIFKSAIKQAVFWGVLAAVAWFLFAKQ